MIFLLSAGAAHMFRGASSFMRSLVRALRGSLWGLVADSWPGARARHVGDLGPFRSLKAVSPLDGWLLITYSDSVEYNMT